MVHFFKASLPYWNGTFMKAQICPSPLHCLPSPWRDWEECFINFLNSQQTRLLPLLLSMWLCAHNPNPLSLSISSQITATSWQRGLRNSVKLWAMPCRAAQDGQVIAKSSDRTWSTGQGNGKPLQYSCHENPLNSMVRQKNFVLNYPKSSSGPHVVICCPFIQSRQVLKLNWQVLFIQVKLYKAKPFLIMWL